MKVKKGYCFSSITAIFELLLLSINKKLSLVGVNESENFSNESLNSYNRKV